VIYGGYGGEGERKRESFRRRILAIGKSDGEERGQEGGREGGREGEKQEANSRNPRRRERRRGKGTVMQSRSPRKEKGGEEQEGFRRVFITTRRQSTKLR